MTFTQSTMLWCIVFALIGAHVYVLDRKIGIKIYARWRKWTSPLGEAKGAPERGFIYNRSNKARWVWAGIIASFNCFLMIGWRHGDPRIEIFQFFLITPFTWMGFMIGPIYFGFKKKREEFFETLDAVESGKLDVHEKVREAANEKLGALDRLVDRIKHFFVSLLLNWKKKEVAQMVPSKPSQPPEDPAVEAQKARESLRHFTGGK